MNYTEELLKSLYMMAFMVEARDPYTGGHLWRVSQFSRVLATGAGLPPKDVARISLGGFLHDLGKIAVPDAILSKSGRLTDKQYKVIKTHPEIGYRLLAGHPLAPLVKDAILSHHERPDGMGYPHGAKGDELSADAKIVAITDAFDAMTSTRSYRRGMPIEKALGIIEECAGRQFDAALAALFVKMGRDGAFDHIVGHSDKGIPMQDCPACGPIIVVRREQKTGEYVFCRSCGYKTTVVRDGDRVSVAPPRLLLNKHGAPDELRPEVDTLLVQEMVEDVLKDLN